MIEYEYPIDDIERVYNCILFSQNAYINKQSMMLVRLLVRLTRNNKHIGSELIQKFINLASQYVSDEKIDKAPLNEIIQLFV